MAIDLAAVRIGDRFLVRDGQPATVMFSSVGDQWSDEFPKWTWNHLGQGLMLRTDSGAMFFLPAVEAEAAGLVPLPDGAP